MKREKDEVIIKKEVINKDKYKTVSSLIAHNKTDYIGICTDNKFYYTHKYEEIYDYVNPMSPFEDAVILNDILYIKIIKRHT